MPATAALLEEARSFLGGEPGPLRVGRDPVNLPMVHHWCQALDDQNPAYLDEEFAKSTRGHLIAPPAMLQTWTMDAPRVTTGSNDEVMKRLDAAGYTSVVAVNYEHDYLRELQHGERISVRSSAEDLSEEKMTALGLGVFTTVKHEYVTDDGEVIGIGRMRLLKFKPPSAAPSEDIGTRPQPAVGRDNAFFWDGVEAGELRIQKCTACGRLAHPPQPLCAHCGSSDQGWVVASGKGNVYSHVTHHYPPLPGVERPHTVLLVELEEGVRFITEWSAGAQPETVTIGMPVKVAFTKVPGGELRPTFEPA
ncbi:MAG: hypothetical protein JWM40_2066 [Frankiales bacterium]|nr:hypothetical protein [Frankiales bacterium]